jgi:hypothetical protein
MSFPLTHSVRRFVGPAALSLGAALCLAAPAGASEPGPYDDEIGAEYARPSYDYRHHEPSSTVERRFVERTYSERTEIVRPVYRRPVYEGPPYARSAYGGPVYGRPVHARPIYIRPDGDDDGECRVVVKRRIGPWGEVTVRKTRVCEDD